MRKGHILIQLLVFLMISMVFLSIAALTLKELFNHMSFVLNKIDRDVDFFMAVDYLRNDFWWHSISQAYVSPDGKSMRFLEKVDNTVKEVRYEVVNRDSTYILRRVANSGYNTVFESRKEISFYELEGLWGVVLEGYSFEMINSTPTETPFVPDFLLPELVEFEKRGSEPR
ncbi:MAG: hypothetical protein J7J68_06665 [Thermotogaceae bacterium]|nr:hypothetical protein [Thermotogaceae bacterium]